MKERPFAERQATVIPALHLMLKHQRVGIAFVVRPVVADDAHEIPEVMQFTAHDADRVRGLDADLDASLGGVHDAHHDVFTNPNRLVSLPCEDQHTSTPLLLTGRPVHSLVAAVGRVTGHMKESHCTHPPCQRFSVKTIFPARPAVAAEVLHQGTWNARFTRKCLVFATKQPEHRARKL